MGFNNVSKAKSPGDDTERIAAKELVGEVVAVELIEYDSKFDGKHGVTKKAELDVIVCTGPHKGVYQRGSWWLGNIAGQVWNALDQGEESATIVKVTSGDSGRGNPWLGVEEVSDAEFDSAQKVIAKVTAQASGGKKKGKKAKKK